MMNFHNTLKLIAIILLVVCAATAGYCHCDCSDSECAMTCSPVVLVDSLYIKFDQLLYAHSLNHNALIPHYAPDGVFQPPESLA